ncbi:MAG: protein-disulfide reductase DsbD [Zoogloeaceae bacterium]|jgi:thiol:disulfide interchange protein DsbD|nr:protein-disulfide reductase DsbD [Zoogloeaceae bacterium]
MWLFLALFAVFVGLFSLPASAQNFLNPAVAFVPEARAVDGHTVEVRFAITRGYYLYRDKFRFALRDAPPGIRLGQPQLPPGQKKHDENFGDVEVFHDEAVITLPVERQDQPGALSLTLNVTSQGCAEAGLCYPPQQQSLTVDLPEASVVAASAPPTAESSKAHAAEALTLLGFFLAGLALTFTPCVLPMLPILMGIIVGGKRVSRARAFFLSLAYVAGMAVAYTAAGVVVGLSGATLAATLQSPWMLSTFAALFVVLALFLFGVFRWPSGMQTFFERKIHPAGGGFVGVFGMGAASILIAGPCIAPPLAGALLYIGQTGDALSGGLMLFCLALGMGVPVLALGASAGFWLPKPGAWMENVQRGFGAVFLGMAIWLAGPLLPAGYDLLAWAALALFCALFLLRAAPLAARTLGALLLIWSLALLAGFFGGAHDPLRPLSVFAGGGQRVAPLAFIPVSSSAELEEKLTQNPGKPALLDFYADWCVACKEMERETFTDPAVRAEMADFTLLRADVTEVTEAHKALLKRFSLYGPPGILFFDATGKALPEYAVIGFEDAPTFAASLRRVKSAVFTPSDAQP